MKGGVGYFVWFYAEVNILHGGSRKELGSTRRKINENIWEYNHISCGLMSHVPILHTCDHGLALGPKNVTAGSLQMQLRCKVQIAPR